MPRRLAAVLALLLVLAGPARAECPPEEPPPAVPAEVLAELVGWIARTTVYDVSRTWLDPPEVVFCLQGQSIPYEDGTIVVEPELRAAYDLSARRIHLVLPWSPDDLFDRSVLLHELVHDVQLRNREWPCPGAPEWEAYRLQDQWLQEHGLFHPFDWPSIRRLSTCPP